jgi:hypothetical protein
MASRSSGHDVSRSFGSDNGANGTPTTPSTSSTPSTPTTHVTGTRYASSKLSRKWGQNFGAAAETSLAGNRRVSRNLELAYTGDDSELLPYRPTNTSNPARPRTVAAGYDRVNHILFVRFRDGAGYEYHDVTQSQWREFRSAPSPGRYINRVLNYHTYYPADW